MRLSWKRIGPREFDHELVCLVASVGSLGLAAIWLALSLPWPRCGFRALTGLPCLSCGATRSAIQFFHGNFASAFVFNPLAFVVYCGIVIFDIYAFTVLATRGPRLRVTEFSTAQKRAARIIILLLLAANWAYLLWARPF